MTRKNEWIVMNVGALKMEVEELLLEVGTAILLELLVNVVKGSLQRYSMVEFEGKTAVRSSAEVIEVLVKKKNEWIVMNVVELIMEVEELLLEVGKAILLDLLVKVVKGGLQEYSLVDWEEINAVRSIEGLIEVLGKRKNEWIG